MNDLLRSIHSISLNETNIYCSPITCQAQWRLKTLIIHSPCPPGVVYHPVREEEKYRTDEQTRDIDGGGTEREQERGGKREVELR